MTAEPLVTDLVAGLESLGVRLWEDDGQLRFRAPAGVMTDERRAVLRGQREAILDHLRAGRGLAITPHPEQRHEPFPLSDVQAAYLLGRRDTFAYGGVACHGYGELTFDHLDVARLEAAWHGLVERHDMLRAVIDADGAQRVLPEVPDYHIAVTETSDLDTGVAAARSDMDHRVYRTDRWPLFELRVTRGPRHSVLHFSIDFLICDFVSIQVLLDELRQWYGEPDREWPPLDIGYRDYLLAERGQRSGSRYERDREYWTARVDELPPAPELPVSTGAVLPRFRRWAATLGPADWAALRQRAGRHGITPSGAVLAAYAEVIGAWSRHPRFTLDVTLLNRPAGHPQVNQLVGDFTAVDLLAVSRDPDAALADRAKQLQAQLWADLDHRLYSGVEVMREITRRRGADAALMPVVFTSAIGLGDASQPAGGAGFGTLTHGISQTPQVWIDCQNMERDGGLATNWDVREGVFPDGLVDDAFAAYETLLRRMATDDEVWEAARPVPLPAAQAVRRRRVNDTAAELPDRLLHHDFVVQARRTPDRVALVTPDAELTYGDLLARAAGIAERLLAEGCRPGDPVAIVMDKGWQQVAAAYGILLAGAAYLPVDTNQPPARRDQILTSAGVRLVLTQRHLAGDGPAIAVEDVPASREVPEPRTHPDDLAYVIYTSGSTGMPKGVMISHRAALNTIVDINRRFGIGPDDRVLGLASLGFDLSVYDIVGPLGIGGRLVLPDAIRRSDPTHWAELVAEHGVTVWNSVPAQLQMLHEYLQAAPTPLPSLRLAMLSGDWIPVALPDQIRGLLPGLRLISLGGATEAAIWSIYHPIDAVDPAWRSIPYGVPLANQTFHVLDAGLHPCPDWVTGELYIGGSGVAIGYLGDEAKTAERFLRHPDTGERLYRTGDLGRYLPDGTIEFLGREDFQVKIRGHRIELAEVESAVQSYPGVGAAAVVVDGDGPLDRRLAAIVEPARTTAAPATPSGARLIEAATLAGSRVLSDVDNDAYLAYLRQLDDVALAVMVDAFRAAGLFRGPDDRHTFDEIRAAAQVAPRHHRLVGRWLRALVTEGRLGYDPASGAYRLVESVPADWQRAERLKVAAGDDSDLLRYFRTSAEHLAGLLRGDEDPVRLLFPEGRLDVSDNLYADALFNRWANRAAGGAVRAIADAVPRDRPLRVLEVGAGAGGTSAEVLAALRGVPVEYLYTDLSPYFLVEARERFAGYPHARFAGYDLDADYRAQGLTPNSFDLVVAGDVLHATRDARRTLARLRELLAPGGWLVFLEMTRDHYQIMTSLELLVRLGDGTDDFADVRQGTGQTFIGRDQWLELLDGSGAELAMCLPATDSPLAEIGMCLFAARCKADRVPVDPAALTRFLAERLPEYMLPSTVQVVDALPQSANGKLDRAVMRGWLDASTAATPAGGEAPRTELEDAVAALWAEVLQVERVGRDHDFFDLGGDSLLAAKLAGRLIEDIPAAGGVFFDELLRQLLEHPTVGELAGYLAAQQAPVVDRSLPSAGAGPLRLLGGAGEPAYLLVHDTTGGLDGYGALAATLARHGSVYGLVAGDDVVLDRLVADHAGAVRDGVSTAVHVLGYGSGGVIAVDLARQLAESGIDVRGLTVLAPDEVPAGPALGGLAAATAGYRPAAYAADITLVTPPGSVPAAWWPDICLGDLRVLTGGVDAVADLLTGPEDG